MKRVILGIALMVALGCIAPCTAYSNDRVVEVDHYIIQPSQISVYFPTIGQDPAPVLSNIYNSANNTIDIAIYSITNPRIIDAIEKAKQRGIKIRIITDRMESKNQYQSEALRRFVVAGIPVLINSHSGLMHLKLSLVDKSFATTGSYNYSQSASQTNDEMMVVMTEPNFINVCQNEFDKMWIDAKNFEKYGGY